MDISLAFKYAGLLESASNTKGGYINIPTQINTLTTTIGSIITLGTGCPRRGGMNAAGFIVSANTLRIQKMTVMTGVEN